MGRQIAFVVIGAVVTAVVVVVVLHWLNYGGSAVTVGGGVAGGVAGALAGRRMGRN